MSVTECGCDVWLAGGTDETTRRERPGIVTVLLCNYNQQVGLGSRAEAD